VVLPIVAVPSLLAWLLGRAVRARRWPDRWPLALIAALTVAAGVAVATGRESGVETGAFVGGVVVGALGLVAAPLLTYYALGRFSPVGVIAVAVIWLVSLAPLAVFWFFAIYVTAALVGCPPDAYECPT
jgi:hypothetical protein